MWWKYIKMFIASVAIGLTFQAISATFVSGWLGACLATFVNLAIITE